MTKKTNANTVNELAVHGVFIIFLFFNMVDQKYCYINFVFKYLMRRCISGIQSMLSQEGKMTSIIPSTFIDIFTLLNVD